MMIPKQLNNIFERFKTQISTESLRARIMRGGIWLGLGGGVEQGLRFIRNLILVRILAPDAFGLLAIILVVNAAFESFTQIGIKEAIIQNPKGKEITYLNGAWWLSFVRSIGLFIIGYLISPWISEFYEMPEMLTMMRLSFLSILFNGAFSVNAYVKIKEMKYKKWVLIEQGGGAIGVIITIILAFMIQNVWALVIGFVFGAGMRCLLSFIICPYCPGFQFDKESLLKLFKFARGMFGLPILYFIFTKIDIFVIGKLCSKNDLGLYSMVLALTQIPSQLISIFIGPLLTPAFSEMQSHNERINNTIMKTTALLVFIWFPMLTFIILYAKDLLDIIYGPQYMLLAVPFAVLFATTMMRTLSALFATFFFAIGKPELQRLFVGIRAIIIVLIIYPAVKRFGLLGGAISLLMAMIIANIILLIQMRKLTKFDVTKYSYLFLKALSVSLIVFIAWIATYNYLPNNSIIKLIPGAIGCLLSFILSMLIFSNDMMLFNDNEI